MSATSAGRISASGWPPAGWVVVTSSSLVGSGGEDLLESVARLSRFTPGWKSLETLLRCEGGFVADWLLWTLLGC